MRALLNVDVARHLGIVLLKPGRELMSLFSGGRVLVETLPDKMKTLPSGCIPDAGQPLRDDPGIRPFFMKERVVRAAGGVNGLESWLLKKVKHCQWPHSDYHHSELVTFRHSTGAIVACWHCDNELKHQTDQILDSLVGINNADLIIDAARIALGFDPERSLSLAELCWWAVSVGIGDEITEEMARRSLRLKEEVFQSVYKESEIVPSVPATSILSPLVAKVARHPEPPAPVKPEVPVVVDPVAPATLFTRPKLIRWVSDGFISWVKTQPCMCCGQSADDAHHLIGWGQGGVGTKAHDIFTIPLCRKHHRTLHHDPVAFEREYGSQPELIIKLLDRAYALGVLA